MNAETGGALSGRTVPIGDECHCGRPVAFGYDGNPHHHRWMCGACDAARCDAYPMECPYREGVSEQGDETLDEVLDRFSVPSWIRPALTDAIAARVAAARADGRESLADAWDEGVKCAGSYGHEDSWTHDMTPYSENPYRALAAPTGHDGQPGGDA